MAIDCGDEDPSLTAYVVDPNGVIAAIMIDSGSEPQPLECCPDE